MGKKVNLEDTVAGEVVGEYVEEFCTKPYYDGDGVQVASGIGRDGKEYPDPVPLSAPLGYQPPEDLMSMIRRMVHSEMAQTILKSADVETIEDADDFDIEDDPLDPLTQWEKVFLPPEAPPGGGPPGAQAQAPTPPVVDKKPNGSPITEGAVASPPPVTPAPPAPPSTVST